MTSRTTEMMTKQTLTNKIIMGMCISTYAYQFLIDPPIYHYTLCTRNVVYLHEWYRIITHAFFHGGIVHLGMNMMATAAVGTLLENRFGSLRHAFTLLWSILLTSLLYVSMAWTFSFVFQNDDLFYTHSVGFSGVLFHLVVIEANVLASDSSLQTTRSVFGVFHVPLRVYPWAMLVAISFILPGVSFTGHLSGILVGTLQTHGSLDFLLPSFSFSREMETWETFKFITEAQGFVPTPSDSVISSMNLRGQHEGGTIFLALQGIKMVFKFIRDITETIKVCIFGYGPIFGERSTSQELELEDHWGPGRSIGTV